MITYYPDLDKKDELYIPRYKIFKNLTDISSFPMPASFICEYSDLFQKMLEFNSLLYNYRIINHRKRTPEEILGKSLDSCELDPIELGRVLDMAAYYDAKEEIKMVNSLFAHVRFCKDFDPQYGIRNSYSDDIKNVDKLLKKRKLTINDTVTILDFYNDYFKYFDGFNDSETLRRLEEAYNKAKVMPYKIEGKVIGVEKYELPRNAWYIIPRLGLSHEFLYNTTGDYGHKEANLINPESRLWHYIEGVEAGEHEINPRDFDPSYYFKLAQDMEENGTPKNTFDAYIGGPLCEFFPLEIFLHYPWTLDEFIRYNRVFNKKLVRLTTGCIMAHAALESFVLELFTYSNNPTQHLRQVLHMDHDEFLIRCCGFHKVSFQNEEDKTIVTSLKNYEIEFREYIQKGWRIEYVSPITISHETGCLEIEKIPDNYVDLSSDHEIIKSFHFKGYEQKNIDYYGE